MSTFTPYLLKFRPVLHERIWGGDYLPELFGIEDTRPIGEAWTLSDHPSSPSICVNGPLSGLTLSEIVRRHPTSYLGQPKPSQFPLLIKFIDAVQDLSVQVHPDDQLARELENQWGKTETWFILESLPSGEVVLGHAFPGQVAVERAAAEGTIGNFVKRRRVTRKEIVHIPPGTVHALLGGTRVVEIQQTSDVTYRLYDWDRAGLDGRPRELHVSKAARAIRCDLNQDVTPGTAPVQASADSSAMRLVVDCPHYRIRQFQLNMGDGQLVTTDGQPTVLIVTEGTGSLQALGESYPLAFGDTYLLPGDIKIMQLHAAEPLHILLTSPKRS